MFGFGVTTSLWSESDVRNVGRWSDRWRLKRLDPSDWNPRQRAFAPIDPLTDFATVRPVDPREELRDELSLRQDFPEVPHGLIGNRSDGFKS